MGVRVVRSKKVKIFPCEIGFVAVLNPLMRIFDAFL